VPELSQKCLSKPDSAHTLLLSGTLASVQEDWYSKRFTA